MLAALDVSRNTALKWLDCSSNHQLNALDVSRNCPTVLPTSMALLVLKAIREAPLATSLLPPLKNGKFMIYHKLP
jgi:hypothetical protein